MKRHYQGHPVKRLPCVRRLTLFVKRVRTCRRRLARSTSKLSRNEWQLFLLSDDLLRSRTPDNNVVGVSEGRPCSPSVPVYAFPVRIPGAVVSLIALNRAPINQLQLHPLGSFATTLVTRTGQLSPICIHLRSHLVCGFLWGYVSELRFSEFRKPQVARSIRVAGSSLSHGVSTRPVAVR